MINMDDKKPDFQQTAEEFSKRIEAYDKNFHRGMYEENMHWAYIKAVVKDAKKLLEEAYERGSKAILNKIVNDIDAKTFRKLYKSINDTKTD